MPTRPLEQGNKNDLIQPIRQTEGGDPRNHNAMQSPFKSTHNTTRRLTAAALSGLVVFAAAAYAGGAGSQLKVQESSIWEKPVWLTDLSLRVGESYDTNVYLSGVPVPAGPDVATQNKSSWVTTITPKIGVDFAKLLGSDSIIKTFTLGYNPDVVLFHNTPDESYSAHRVTTTVKGKTGDVSFSLDNAFTYINGDSAGLLYPAGNSSYVNNTVRERRDQWQERTKAFVKINAGDFFLRPAVSLLYYNLNTEFRNANLAANTGYTNYVDRYDLNGGADLGYNVSKDLAVILGYRYGHQEQANLPDWVATKQTQYRINASSDYQRVLFGIEGSPLKWLKIEAAVGPQFTSYTGSRPYAGTVVANGKIDPNPTDVYAEASVTIAPTASDILVLKYRRWNWVSSTGINAYRDTVYDASFRHQITKALQLELGLRAANSDYNPSSYRNDWDYTASAGLKYAVTKNLGLDVSYAYDKGHNEQIVGVTNAATREFERSIVSTGVSWKF